MYLCFRCQHRCNFLEDVCDNIPEPRKPRQECGDISKSKYSCYMFELTRPVEMEKTDPDDPRPSIGPWVFTCRTNMVKESNVKLKLKVHETDPKNDKFIMYWEPVKSKVKKKLLKHKNCEEIPLKDKKL